MVSQDRISKFVFNGFLRQNFQELGEAPSILAEDLAFSDVKGVIKIVLGKEI